MSIDIEKIGNIEISSGTNPNLLPHTDIKTYGVGYLSSYSSGTIAVDNSVVFNGKPTLKINPSSSTTSSGATSAYNNSVNLTSGKTYCYSCWIRSTVEDSWDYSSLGHFQTWTSSASHNRSALTYIMPNVPANKWVQVAQTFVPSANCEFRSFFIYFANTSQSIWVADIKLEEGSVPTPWIPNSGDSSFTSNNQGLIENDGSGFKIYDDYIQATNIIEY